MNKEELIHKWLDHSLTTNEQELFENLDHAQELSKLDQALSDYKAPDFDESANFEKIQDTIQNISSKKSNYFKYAIGIAVAVIIGFVLIQFLPTNPSEITTQLAEKTNIKLPNKSLIKLNAESTVTYDESQWDDKRLIHLQGEAYFEVTKGNSFEVKTNLGLVRVLGTKFNVLQRKDFLEVICYEGKVQVEINDESYTLTKGKRVTFYNNQSTLKQDIKTTIPNWINNESSFESSPLWMVVDELERQYDIKINLQPEEKDRVFTGSFPHTNLDLAIQSVVLPLQLTSRKVDHKTFKFE